MDEISSLKDAMRVSPLIFFLLLSGYGAGAQIQPRTDEQILKAVSTHTGIEIRSTEYFQTAPPEAAWKAFDELFSYANAYGNKDLLKQGGRAIAENASVEKYVTDGLAQLENSTRTSNERTHFLVPLCQVPTPWSLRLLARYLMDEAPINDLNDVTDQGYESNEGLAVVALSQMGFFDAPTKGDHVNVAPSVTKAWRVWWKKNEPIVEQRIHEINPGYYPPLIPASVSATQTPTVVEADTLTPPSKIGQKVKSVDRVAAPAVELKEKQSLWPLYLGGGLLAVAILGALAWAFKK